MQRIASLLRGSLSVAGSRHVDDDAATGGPVTVLAGFSGHGSKFGPAIGELAADLAEGRPGTARFALGRTAPAR
ncbi:hypothetical protein [Streptomyces sp. NPDC058629]|uniref:hypothetical protein n=1 Tax=Streptomyces sp. NPDC058629 TaxID=3346565 RepID=UPI0036580426